MASVFQSSQQPIAVFSMTHSSQQNADQLSEASPFILSTTQPPEASIYPTSPSVPIGSNNCCRTISHPLQMLTQRCGFQVAQTPSLAWKVNSFTFE